MGKTILISLGVVISIIALIFISLNDRIENSGITVAKHELSLHIRKISNYALQHGIQQLMDQNVDISSGYAEEHFSNFNIMEGRVDSLIYTEIAPDTIEVRAYVWGENSGVEKTRESKVYLKYEPIIIKPAGVTDVITTVGGINTGGASSVSGSVNDYASFTFEDIIGYSKDRIKSSANNYYLNPPNNTMPVDKVTWFDCKDISTTQIISNLWNGSGLLVVDGNLKISGGTFYGIIWITGELEITGNPHIYGSIFVESSHTVDLSKLTGSSDVEYDADAVDQTWELFPKDKNPYNILGWYE